MSIRKNKQVESIPGTEDSIASDRTVPPSASQILSASVAGASALVFLQLCSRLLTFALHQIILRYTSAKTLGFAAVKLELLLSTILFLSREGFRGALLRGGGETEVKQTKENITSAQEKTPVGAIKYTSKQFQTQKVTNLAYIPTVIGAFTSFIACAYFFSTINPADAESQPFLYTSVTLYGLAAYAELLVEPLMILAMTNLYFRLRVSAEGAAVVVRCLLTFAMTIYGSQNMTKNGVNKYGVLAFAVGQLSFAITLLVFYVAFFLRKVGKGEMEARNLVPQKLADIVGGQLKTFYFDPYLLGLASTMTKQSLLKHVLTEGDKMLVAKLSTDTEQGVYAFVVNYGSLVVRILFQPLEETSRTLFSKLLADINNPTASPSDAKEASSPPPKITRTQQETIITSLTILTTILKFHLILGLLFICFGTNYTSTLIDLLVGAQWSRGTNAPAVLGHYCVYVPIMGVNGITEAFVQAVANSNDLASLSRWMFVFSLGFVAAGYLFMALLRLGASGLIAANAVNLSMRILWSWLYIRRYYLVDRGWPLENVKRELQMKNILPKAGVWIVFVAAWAITKWSESVIGWDGLREKAMHVGIGVATFAVVATVTYRLEHEFLRRLIQLIRTKKQS